MASYMRNPMFGQDDSYDQGWDYDTGSSGYSDQPASVGYTSGPEGSGVSVDWTTIGTKALDVLGRTLQPDAYQQPVGSGYMPPVYAPPVGTVPAPGSIAATGSINSTVLLAGGLGLAALFLFRKR